MSQQPTSNNLQQQRQDSTGEGRRISVGTGLDRLLKNLVGFSSPAAPTATGSNNSNTMTSPDDDGPLSPLTVGKSLPAMPRPAGPRAPPFPDADSASYAQRPPLKQSRSPSANAPFAASATDNDDSSISRLSSSSMEPPVTSSGSAPMTTGQMNEMARKRMTLNTGKDASARPDSMLIPRVTVANLNEMPEVSLPGFTPFSNSAAAQSKQKQKRKSTTTMLQVPRSADPEAAAAGGGGAGEVTRKRSMTRPERDRRSRQPRQDLLTAGGISASSSQTYLASSKGKAVEQDFSRYYRDKWTPWTIFARVVTFYAPDFALSWFGMKSAPEQEAWREKMALVTIIVAMCALLGFVTFGFQYVACGLGATQKYSFKYVDPNVVNIRGDLYDISAFQHPGVRADLSKVAGKDVSWIFPLYPEMLSGDSACSKVPGVKANASISCSVDGADLLGFCHTMDQYGQMLTQLSVIGEQSYDWSDIEGSDRYMVFNGIVLDLDRYFKEGNEFLGGPDFTKILLDSSGKDSTMAFRRSSDLKLKMDCLVERFKVGVVNQDSAGCLASQVFMWTSLIVILAVIFIKFIIAVFFNWTISHKLGKALPPPPNYDDDTARSTSPTSQQTSSRFPAAVDNKRSSMMMPVKSRYSHQYNSHSNFNTVRSAAPRSVYGTVKPNVSSPLSSSGAQSLSADNIAGIDPSGILRTILLVTCYSEGESGLRTTLDSLARTTFPDTHKLLFIIADGIITGSGNTKSTPDILIDMIEMDPQFDGTPKPYSYVALAEGMKRHNMARVYAGRYHVEGHAVPTILVVKCGTPEEQSSRKPGNRGKRDSQVLLMQFLSKCLFDDRMTTLEYDMFTKITAVSSCFDGASLDMVTDRITPDLYELVLMVDADTKVMPDALTAMSWTMANDSRISGLCGETRIANKSASWVTAIQVFEYHISHFLAKSFESVFGCVTCLPGCFCMYRIKAPKGPVNADGTQYYVPVLANPDIVEQYSENFVDTLHKKNLLLLGEDRYLTTLMLKTFPKRKMVFVPRAVCKTVVPDTFDVLLSQRRRWINSTVHNLLELVQIRDLCGIFCFSMQFVIFMELVGTAVLPAAITFTLYLLIISFFMTPVPVIPLVLLALILGLPAILILITSRRWVYVLWMGIYLVSLPIWNFVLPVYAYWHFDDFSWGETRKVEGQIGDKGHGGKEGVFDSSKIVMKQWSEFERERLRDDSAVRRGSVGAQQQPGHAGASVADMSKSWPPTPPSLLK